MHIKFIATILRYQRRSKKERYVCPQIRITSVLWGSASLRFAAWITRLSKCALGGGVSIVSLVCLSAASLADLQLCNATESRVGIAIGYKGEKQWITEGWWNVGARTCETLLKGPLPSRFVYVHAVDYERGGEWVGSSFMCTHEKSFAIHGVNDCEGRGYQRTRFFEIDTGDSLAWTVKLTDPEKK